jgi:hypothetical protein
MNRDELEERLSRHGSDLGRWPAAARAAAESLMASDAGAAKLCAEAQRLDALLGTAMRPVPLDSAAIGRIMVGIDDHHHRDLTLRPTRRLFAWASAAMMVFLVAGYAVGVAFPSSSYTSSDDTIAGLMFGSSTTTDGASDSGSIL